MAQTNKSKEFNRKRNMVAPESMRQRLSIVDEVPIDSLGDLIRNNPELADQDNRNSIIHTGAIGSSLETDINQE